MRLLAHKKGLTLIEVILSIAILGIIAIVFLTVFTTGVKGVFEAGRWSEAEYETQHAMENELADVPSNVPNVQVAEYGSTNISITFGTTTITVHGKTINTDYNDGKHKVHLTSFVPD